MKKSGSGSKEIDDKEKDHATIESYGISVTTLEEVFLRVAGCDRNEAECIDHRSSNLVSLDPSPKKILHPGGKLLGNFKSLLCGICSVLGKACQLIFAVVLSFVNFLLRCSCCMISRTIFWQHCKALLIKRAISARRDRKTIVFQLLIPALFLFVGLIFLKLKPHPDQQSVTFTTLNFNPLIRGDGGGAPIPYDLSWPIAKKVC